MRVNKLLVVVAALLLLGGAMGGSAQRVGALSGAEIALIRQNQPTNQTQTPTPVVTLAPMHAPNSPAAAPDLVVDTLVVSPLQIDPNNTTGITFTIKNIGDAATSGTFSFTVFVSPTQQPPDDAALYSKTTVYGLPLPPGDSISLNVSPPAATFGQEGVYPIYVSVDRANKIAESNENNNVKGPINLVVGNPPVGGDSYEPDNTCPQSKPITTDGTEQSHTLAPMGDADWVKFSASSGVGYHVQAIADGADADLSVELYTKDSLDACRGSFGGGGIEFDFTAPATSEYFLKVVHNQQTYGPNTQYRLKITQKDQCNGSYEPNNTCQVAGDIVINGALQQHSICQAGDADWVKFPVSAGATYIVSSTNVGGQADTQLSLFASCDNASAANSGQQIQFTSPISGYVYVKAEHQNATVFGANTNYSLQVTQQTAGCASDAFEPDNSSGAASTLAIGGAAQAHNSCPAADTDWVKVQATAGVTYTFETSNLGNKADTLLCLFDSSGTTQLFCDDDGGPGKGSRLIWQAPATGNYFLQIKDFDLAVAGPDTRYELRGTTTLCTLDGLEPDNTQAQAKAIDINGAGQIHNICAAGDVDWVKFTVPAGGYTIKTSSVAAAAADPSVIAEADTVIDIFNDSGAAVTSNDDYTTTTSSQVGYTFAAGTYFVRVRHYNPTRFGNGTEFMLSVAPGLPPAPPPTPTPPPTKTPTPTPQPSGVRTLILVNRERVAARDAGKADALLNKLAQLAARPEVGGEVIRLDNNTTISAAYTDWLADKLNVSKANQITSAIRAMIMSYLQQHGGIEYLVLVGDDDMLPSRRMQDNTPDTVFPEKKYTGADASNSIGAALRSNHYLTDDYFADKDPSTVATGEMYVPDLAVGRLIGSPQEMMDFIDSFLAQPSTVVNNVLVTGYDFVQDAGTAVCNDWKADLGVNKLQCQNIGDTWTLDNLRGAQLSTSTRYEVQSINGHADHGGEGVPVNKQVLKASEIKASTANFVGALVYTLGCHSGLNVPDTNSVDPTDLAEAFSFKRANYVGNTGYGWGIRGGIGLSEKLMQYYTQELRKEAEVSMGKALAIAKRRYFQEDQSIDPFDQKILEESVFYGLPMWKLTTGGTLGSLDNTFPSIDVRANLPGPSFGDETWKGSADIDLKGALGAGDLLSKTTTNDGVYYSLDGSTFVEPGKPVQPLFYTALQSGDVGARSALFLEGSYQTLSDFDPHVAAPENDFYQTTTETLQTADSRGWYPAVLASVQQRNGQSSLVTQFGQYDALSGEARLYDNVKTDVYFSTSADTAKPTVTVIDGLFNPAINIVTVKVGAVDESGIERVVATYTTGGTNGVWKSVDLQFSPSALKWIGTFPGGQAVRYFVQVVDKAGNIGTETNKGLYFVPPVGGSERNSVYLPVMKR